MSSNATSNVVPKIVGGALRHPGVVAGAGAGSEAHSTCATVLYRHQVRLCSLLVVGMGWGGKWFNGGVIVGVVWLGEVGFGFGVGCCWGVGIMRPRLLRSSPPASHTAPSVCLCIKSTQPKPTRPIPLTPTPSPQHKQQQRAALLQEKARSSHTPTPNAMTTPSPQLPSHTPPMAPIAVAAAAIPVSHSRSAADIYREKRQVCK